MRNSDTLIQPLSKRNNFDLLEVCSNCFALIMQLRKTSEFGNLDVLRQRIRELLNNVESRARKAGFDHEDTHMVIFALVAFLDETIISSQWDQKAAWLSKPLQLEFFNRFDAGEEFFVRLDKIRYRPQHNSSVLEVYYYCMALGFKGKYQLTEREKLRLIIEETYAELKQIKGKSSDLLSPHGRRKDEIIEVVKKEVPVWVIIVSAVTLGFFFYIIMTFLINDEAGRVIQFITNIL